MKYKERSHTFQSALSVISMATLLSACFGSEEPLETQVIEDRGSTAIADFTSSSGGGSSGNETPPIPIDPNTDPTRTVCDPFANNPSHPGAGYHLGVVGKIAYLTPEMPRYSSARDYFKYGIISDAMLFFTDISIPTRAFDLGFTTQSGITLTTPAGNTLYEYFGIQLETQIQLDSDQPAGLYQFAILSDDGAVLDLDLGSGYTNLINNDGTHPTRMGCATQPVYLDHSHVIPARIYYHQGPRYHIALNLLWRPWTGSASDPSCGTSGNSLFWNSNVVPSAPTATFNQLLNRGWSVLKPVHYALPSHVTENPCVGSSTQDPATVTVVSSTPADGSPTRSTSATFQLSANYSDATFECSLNGAPRSACAASVSYSSLPQGMHTFQAWAIHSSAPSDPQPVTVIWTVDLTAPTPTGISYSSTSTSISISWNTSEPSVGQVRWGTTTDTPLLTDWESSYGTTHSVMLNELTPDIAYFFRITVKDIAGNVFTSNRMGLLTQP